MTRFALCIARFCISRTIASELPELRHHQCQCVSTINRFCRLSLLNWFVESQTTVTLPIVRGTAPSNSSQKLSRPATGPPAEPAHQHTSVAGGMPPASLIARRFAARL
jgi:hypothetical protein